MKPRRTPAGEEMSRAWKTGDVEARKAAMERFLIALGCPPKIAKRVRENTNAQRT